MEEYCKNCGASIKDNSKFCHECGSKIENTNILKEEEVNFCENCGNKLSSGEEFCSECGTNIYNPQPKNTKKSSNNKNVIIIIGILIAISLVAVVLSLFSAPGVEDVGTQVVSVGNNEFKIPGDYVIDPSTIDVDYTGYNVIFSQAYSNDSEIIYIGVMNMPYGADSDYVASSQGGVQKNMMGVNGYLNEKDGMYFFAFADGNYLNVVSVSNVNTFDDISYLR